MERLALKSREVNAGGTGVAKAMHEPASGFKASNKQTINKLLHKIKTQSNCSL